jgi:hypothetical protein
MKCFFTLTLLLSQTLVLANEFQGYDKGYIERINQIRAFVEKNDKCYASTFMIAKKSVRQYFSGYVQSVICASTLTFGHGTMNERTGCALVNFYPDTNSYREMMKRPFDIPMASKACENGGFEELMNKSDIWYPAEKPFPAKNLLFKAYGAPISMVNTHIINAKNDKVKIFLKTELDQIEKKSAKELQEIQEKEKEAQRLKEVEEAKNKVIAEKKNQKKKKVKAFYE